MQRSFACTFIYLEVLVNWEGPKIFLPLPSSYNYSSHSFFCINQLLHYLVTVKSYINVMTLIKI